MEVLLQPSDTPEHGRRRSDRSVLADRSLDWQDGPLDVLLAARHPATLIDPLTAADVRLRLLPSPARQTEHAGHAGHAGKAGQALREDDRAPASDAEAIEPEVDPPLVLRTTHSAEVLSTRCRQILVANALVKERGSRRLYLIAGFVEIPGATADDPLRLAPLLWYPAILARCASDVSSDTSRSATPDDRTSSCAAYEAILETSRPSENAALRAWCEQAEIALPALDSFDDVASYLAAVETALIDEHRAAFVASIAFGTNGIPRSVAPPSAVEAAIPSMSSNVDADLALAIVGQRSVPMLLVTLALVDGRCGANDSHTSSSTDATYARPIPVTALREYAKRLIALGFGHVTFPRIADLEQVFDPLIARIQPLVALLDDEPATGPLPMTPRLAIRMANSMELLDKAPLDFERYAHADLAHESALGALNRARHQAALIDDEIQSLRDAFEWNRVPPMDELLTLIDDLRAMLERQSYRNDADRFTVRRRYAAFARQPGARLESVDLERLVRLAKTLRFRELFVNNAEYRRAFGPGYRGLRTDWTVLQTAAHFANEFARVFESRALAIHALSDWPMFRSRYLLLHEALRTAAGALHTLLEIIGPAWQFRPIEGLLRHVDSVRAPLAATLREHINVQARASGTPDEVMRQVGPREADALVEAQADDVQRCIDSWLDEPAARRDRLVPTLDWLREACRIANEHVNGDAMLLAAFHRGSDAPSPSPR